ncbi:hypothetical protein [Nocardia brasiliensis]|uniref:hypothetical protein n=1 Tax=Nocardia brasiliensis TaxID=37326 RepID=UPI0033E67019
MTYSTTPELWARIEFELMNGPYRTDQELANHVGVPVRTVERVTRSLWRRTTKADHWSPMDSYRLDQAVQAHRRALRVGPPPVVPLSLPADNEAQAAA